MINPKVRLEAELFTDGRVTDQVLQDTAGRLGLDLVVDSLDQLLEDLDLEQSRARQKNLDRLALEISIETRAFDRARAGLGEANRRTIPPLAPSLPPIQKSLERIRRDQGIAMRRLNQVRNRLKALKAELEKARG